MAELSIPDDSRDPRSTLSKELREIVHIFPPTTRSQWCVFSFPGEQFISEMFLYLCLILFLFVPLRLCADRNVQVVVRSSSNARASVEATIELALPRVCAIVKEASGCMKIYAESRPWNQRTDTSLFSMFRGSNRKIFIVGFKG